MSDSDVRFSRLRRLLIDLEFAEIVVPGSHVGYRHEGTDTVVMLPEYRANETVAPRHLFPVRRLLEGKGLLEADAFDDMLGLHSLKQSAS